MRLSASRPGAFLAAFFKGLFWIGGINFLRNWSVLVGIFWGIFWIWMASFAFGGTAVAGFSSASGITSLFFVVLGILYFAALFSSAFAQDRKAFMRKFVAAQIIVAVEIVWILSVCVYDARRSSYWNENDWWFDLLLRTGVRLILLSWVFFVPSLLWTFHWVKWHKENHPKRLPLPAV